MSLVTNTLVSIKTSPFPQIAVGSPYSLSELDFLLDCSFTIQGAMGQKARFGQWDKSTRLIKVGILHGYNIQHHHQ